MTFQASIYGRLTNDPNLIPTKTGTSMALCNIAISIECNERDITDIHTEFISIVSFGKVADSLLRHSKGDLLSLSGQIRYKTYNDSRQLVIMADSIISSKTVRPFTGSKKQNKPLKVKVIQSPTKKKRKAQPSKQAIAAAMELLSSVKDTHLPEGITGKDIESHDLQQMLDGEFDETELPLI